MAGNLPWNFNFINYGCNVFYLFYSIQIFLWYLIDYMILLTNAYFSDKTGIEISTVDNHPLTSSLCTALFCVSLRHISISARLGAPGHVPVIFFNHLLESLT